MIIKPWVPNSHPYSSRAANTNIVKSTMCKLNPNAAIQTQTPTQSQIMVPVANIWVNTIPSRFVFGLIMLENPRDLLEWARELVQILENIISPNENILQHTRKRYRRPSYDSEESTY